MVRLKGFLFIIALFLCQQTTGQAPKRYTSSEIFLKLQKLNVLGNVLYVAAHPDDENTQLITWLSNEKKVNTGYFSFTRGDGGQNLVGPEIREQLGVIRTQELLAARRIDGGKQFFSRAVDFGYSKNPDETFNIWDKQKALADLVYVIRYFKPDLIITRFNNIPGTTHGHHTASAILAHEAFKKSGDRNAFPAQLKDVDTWQPKSLYWNAYWWSRSAYQKDTSELIKVNVGAYNPLIGKSYSEIAASSRSMHKSQGFGMTGRRGDILEYLQFEMGEKSDKDLFGNVDISWNRVKGGEHISRKVEQILEKYNVDDPASILPDLFQLRKDISGVKDDYWRSVKIKEIDEIIVACAGMFVEVKAISRFACPGARMELDFELINRSGAQIHLEKYEISGVQKDSVLIEPLLLKQNKDIDFRTDIQIPDEMQASQPYWLQKKGSLGMFEIPEQRMVSMPENPPALTVKFFFGSEGNSFSHEVPVVYKENSPVDGELYRPFIIAPPVFVNMPGEVIIFSEEEAKSVEIKIKSGAAGISGSLSLKLPDDWKTEPANYDIRLGSKGEEQVCLFSVVPPKHPESVEAKAIVEINGEEYNYSISEITYDHIPQQTLFMPAISRFVKLDLKKNGEKIGYVMGAGDNIPDNLRQIGYEVDILNDLEINNGELDQYDAIIYGVRALNTVDKLKYDHEKFLEYVKRGGTLIIQYNTNSKLVTDNFAPYPMELSRDRVTTEEAEVRVLLPDHRVMNYPNKITYEDFEGWVQERGLYFPGTWSNDYQAVLSSNDPGENPLDGGLLIAKYGEGYYVYTGYSWFRELPAGVSGAYRIFVNLISLSD